MTPKIIQELFSPKNPMKYTFFSLLLMILQQLGSFALLSLPGERIDEPGECVSIQ